MGHRNLQFTVPFQQKVWQPLMTSMNQNAETHIPVKIPAIEWAIGTQHLFLNSLSICFDLNE
jgi:hypothetical protein